MNGAPHDVSGRSTEPIPTGAFPFPLTGGPTESPYLTWLRNRSNYMATRGLLDYLRSVGVLVRGVVVNFLIFLPSLLLTSVALAYSHHWMLAHPYYLTMAALSLGALWIVAFAVLTPIFAVARFKKSLDTGSESSVAQRDLYERSFGVFVLALVALAALESLPWALEYLHDMIELGEFSWASGFATLATGVALFSAADKLLSLLAGLKKVIAMALIGVMGLLVPLVVILYATDFLVYGLPPSPTVMLSPLVVPAVGVVAILVALTIGYKLGAFTGTESMVVGGMLVATAVLLVIVAAVALVARGARAESLDALDTQLQPLREVASGLDALPNRQEIPADITPLVDAFAAAHRRVNVEDIALLKEQPRDAMCELVPRAWLDGSRISRDSLRESLTCWQDRARHEAERTEWDRRYFSVRMPFIVLGHRLSTRSDEDLAPLRRGIARLAHGSVLEQIAAAGGDDRVAALLRRHLVERFLPSNQWRGAHDDPAFAQALVERFKASTVDVKRRDDAIARASQSLQRSIGADLAPLVGEEALFRRVAEKFASVPGRAETARLEGKVSMARLLTRSEMIDLVFEELRQPDAFNRTHRRRLVENALPVFPPRQAIETGGDANATTDEDQRETRDTARVLASLAESSPVPDEGPLSLAFYFGTRAVLRNDDQAPVRDELTPTETARAAGVRLARRALADLGVGPLVVLAFRLDQPAETLALSADSPTDAFLAVRRDALQRAHEEVRQDANESARLAAFLELERTPLVDLAGGAFTASSRDATDDGSAGDDAPPDVEGLRIYQWRDRLAHNVVLASKALGHDTEALASLAREVLVEMVLDPKSSISQTERDTILDEFGLFNPLLLGADELAHMASASFWSDTSAAEDLITRLKFGRHGRLEPRGLSAAKRQLTEAVIAPKAIFVTLLAVVIWLGCWLTVDVNLTSAHSLYRDRLASAFLIRRNASGEVTIEDDIDLDALCQYDAGSTAPYHIINAALNLQGSTDAGLRDRRSDFFMFSKRFVGGPRTGYCRSETLERVFPTMSVATAMAISAAAASPNMGRATSPPLVLLMTLLNIRLGYWIPNPGRLEEESRHSSTLRRRDERRTGPGGLTFDEVFAEELAEICRRWEQLDLLEQRHRSDTNGPTVDHGLVGIGFSGGGIRSAALNLGITQVLHARGVFDHIDYMSTVSGGGYLGSSISTLMRARRPRGGGDARQDIVQGRGSLGDRFRWRVRPTAFLREMLSDLDETRRWVNLSDGGHLENLAGIELLRRRCRYIIIGDGEADPDLHFAGLATLIRCASLDLGIDIDVDLDEIRLRGRGRGSKVHWVVGTIRYPERDPQGRRREGFLLYLKSSFTGDEGVAIQEYRHRYPAFPHQATADQFFDEDQFEAYRALGQHIAEAALPAASATPMSFTEFAAWFETLGPKAPTTAS